MIIAVLIYGAEVWTPTDTDKGMLGMFVRKVERTNCVDAEWRTHDNHELYTL